jgi:hypothetical protein
MMIGQSEPRENNSSRSDKFLTTNLPQEVHQSVSSIKITQPHQVIVVHDFIGKSNDYFKMKATTHTNLCTGDQIIEEENKIYHQSVLISLIRQSKNKLYLQEIH